MVNIIELIVVARKEETPAENSTIVGSLGDGPSDGRLANPGQAVQPEDAGGSGDIAVNPLGYCL